MPYLKLNTNRAICDAQAPPLLSQLPQLVAKKTGKPERYVPAEFWGWNGSTFG